MRQPTKNILSIILATILIVLVSIFTSCESKAKSEYKEFLKSEYWKQCRNIVLKRDNYTCRQCGNKSDLQVHHLTYKHHYDELNHLEDLITLCDKCHEKISK